MSRSFTELVTALLFIASSFAVCSPGVMRISDFSAVAAVNRFSTLSTVDDVICEEDSSSLARRTAHESCRRSGAFTADD